MKLMLVIVVWLACSGLSLSQTLEKTLSNHVSKLFGNDSKNCIYITTSAIGYNDIFRHIFETKDKKVIQLDLAKQPDIKDFAKLLKNEAFCVLTFYHGENLKILSTLASMTKIINNNVIVYAGTQKPSDAILLLLNRPLLWAQLNAEKEFINVHSFCPKMGKPKLPRSMHVTSCNATKCTSLHGDSRHLDIRQVCADHFSGQVVTLAEFPVAPYIISPKFYGVKRISGCAINLLFYYAQRYKFRPNFYVTGAGPFNPRNQSFGPGKFDDVVHRRADLATGGFNHVLLYFFDFGHPFYYSQVRFFTRTPRKVTVYGNITRPFTLVIWVFTTVALFSLASLMLVIYKIYTRRTMMPYKLTMLESSKFNFYLYPFAKFTEPDPLPWFDKWSTGKFVVFLWSLLSWSLIMFYTSNLRSYLVMINYEPPAKTLMDIVNRNQKVYIHELAIPQSEPYLIATGQKDTPLYKVSQMAARSNGWYDPVEHGGPHREAPKDLQDNGAFIFLEEPLLPFLYKTHPLMIPRYLRVVDGYAHKYHATQLMKKHSPGSEDLSGLMRTATEMGLIQKWYVDGLPSTALLKIKPPQVGLHALTMPNFYTLFFFYLCGLFLSSMMFMVEERKKIVQEGRRRLSTVSLVNWQYDTYETE